MVSIDRLERERLAQKSARSVIFVFPSLTGTFGNVVLAAHACGLPAIVSSEGGPREIVRLHHSGLVVDARRSAALAEALTRVREDRSRRSQLTAEALGRARESVGTNLLDFL